MASVEQKLWNIFTYYTLHGNPLDPEHMRSQQFVKFCKTCQIVGSGTSTAAEPLVVADVVVAYTAEVKRKRPSGTPRTGQKMDFSDFLTALMKLSARVYPGEKRASVDAAFEKLLLNNVLPFAESRSPAELDITEHEGNPELEDLRDIFNDALEQIFQYYATGADVARGSRGPRDARGLTGTSPSRGSPPRGSPGRMGRTGGSFGAASSTASSFMGRASNSMKNALSYAGFLKFAADFDLSSSVILSTLELGQIYLASLREVDPEAHIRKLTFDEFWDALLRCAIVAYSKISKSGVADKLKGLFLYMWRAINRSVPRAVTERRSATTYAGDLMSGAMLFNKRFTALWQDDDFRDYLSPEAAEEESGRAVLRRLMHSGVGGGSASRLSDSGGDFGTPGGAGSPAPYAAAAAAGRSSGDSPPPRYGAGSGDYASEGSFADRYGAAAGDAGTGPASAPGSAPQPPEDADFAAARPAYGSSPGRADEGRQHYDASRARLAGLEPPAAASAGFADPYRLPEHRGSPAGLRIAGQACRPPESYPRLMEATSTTPGRSGWGAGRAYYADPKSPIASTPQQRRSGRGYPTTPSMASLSPMKHSEIVRARRVDERGAAGDVPAGRTGGLFSPTARIAEEDAAAVAVANTDKENRLGGARAAAAIAAEAATGCAPTPMLAAAPPGRSAVSGASSAHGSSSSSSPARASRDPAEADGVGSKAPPGSRCDVGRYPSVSSTASAASAGTAATIPAHDSEAHPGEMSTALTAAAAADLASRVSAAHAAIEATDNWEAYEEFNPYLFIRLLPPYGSVRPRVNRVVLPRKVRDAPPISLVLDLDETLVHCSVEPIPDADLRFPVVFGGHTYQVYVRKRPFLERFLARVASKFEVTVFTASQSVYASRLLDLIDPHHRWIRHRLYRESCLNVDGNYIKDLNVLGRDLKQTVLVDNSQHAFGYHLDNGVPIESWFEDPDDRELLKLAWFLERELHGCEDVRPIVRRKFRMRSLVEHR